MVYFTPKRAFVIALIYKVSVPSILISLTNDCKSYFILFTLYLLLDMFLICYNIKSILYSTEYFYSSIYTTVLSLESVMAFIFGIVSAVFFVNKDTYCDESSVDFSLNTIFYIYTVLVIILNQFNIHYIKSSRIQPSPEPVYELKSFTNNLKGKIVYDKISECSICLEKEDENKYEIKVKIEDDSKEEDKEEIVILHCSHLFHYKCINSCFQNKITKCPLCRIEYIN